jgi:hypothetical protein
MAREKAYAGKRAAILDAAQRLVYTRGYEQMTIQDVLDALHISPKARSITTSTQSRRYSTRCSCARRRRCWRCCAPSLRTPT